jgi:hypothetical protein
MRGLWRRLVEVVRRDRVDRDVTDEMAAHVEMRDARNARRSAESSGTKQRVTRPSTSVRIDAARDRLASAASESSDAERLAPRPGVPIPRPVCPTRTRYRRLDGLEAV